MAAVFKGEKDKIRVKVKAKIPLDEGKTTIEHFVGIFRVPKVEEARELLDEASENKALDSEILREWLLDWDKLLDEDGEPIEFNEENFEKALSLAPYRNALTRGFMEVLFGKEALRVKN